MTNTTTNTKAKRPRPAPFDATTVRLQTAERRIATLERRCDEMHANCQTLLAYIAAMGAAAGVQPAEFLEKCQQAVAATNPVEK